MCVTKPPILPHSSLEFLSRCLQVPPYYDLQPAYQQFDISIMRSLMVVTEELDKFYR